MPLDAQELGSGDFEEEGILLLLKTKLSFSRAMTNCQSNSDDSECKSSEESPPPSTHIAAPSFLTLGQIRQRKHDLHQDETFLEEKRKLVRSELETLTNNKDASAKYSFGTDVSGTKSLSVGSRNHAVTLNGYTLSNLAKIHKTSDIPQNQSFDTERLAEPSSSSTSKKRSKKFDLDTYISETSSGKKSNGADKTEASVSDDEVASQESKSCDHNQSFLSNNSSVTKTNQTSATSYSNNGSHHDIYSCSSQTTVLLQESYDASYRIKTFYSTAFGSHDNNRKTTDDDTEVLTSLLETVEEQQEIITKYRKQNIEQALKNNQLECGMKRKQHELTKTKDLLAEAVNTLESQRALFFDVMRKYSVLKRKHECVNHCSSKD